MQTHTKIVQKSYVHTGDVSSSPTVRRIFDVKDGATVVRPSLTSKPVPLLSALLWPGSACSTCSTQAVYQLYQFRCCPQPFYKKL